MILLGLREMFPVWQDNFFDFPVMRRLFLVAFFSFLCAVCFAEQPWEDISAYAPSFDRCKIKLLDDDTLLFNVTFDNVTFGFAIGGVDEGNFLGLINSDKRLTVKQSLVDAFLCDTYSNQKDCCDFLFVEEDGRRRMYRATSSKLVTIPQDLCSDFEAAAHKKLKPAARDWDFSVEDDGETVSRNLAASSEKKTRPQTRDWQLPSERTGEPEKTGVFAMADKIAERKQTEESLRAIAEASEAAGDDLRRELAGSWPSASSSASSHTASASSGKNDGEDDFSAGTILFLCLIMAVLTKVFSREETEDEKKKRKARERASADADRRRRDAALRWDEQRRRNEYMRDQQDRWNGLK